MVVFQIMCETYVLQDFTLPLRSGIRHAEPARKGRGRALFFPWISFGFALVGFVLVLESLACAIVLGFSSIKGFLI